jgi:hypothetical protein
MIKKELIVVGACAWCDIFNICRSLFVHDASKDKIINIFLTYSNK